MPVQQIIYHMLRVFINNERLTDSDDSGAGKLNNYHIKTLMLWACELKPRTWWTDDVSLVRICVELLHDLAVWLTEARCTHYFINNCNLVDSSFNLEMIRYRLTSISTSWLSSWFVNNYIQKCAGLCPCNIERLYDNATTTELLQNAVLVIVKWRANTTLLDKFEVFDDALYDITSVVSLGSLTPRTVTCWFTELSKISTSLPVYFSSVAFLHVAYRTARCGLNDELMDVLASLVRQPVGSRRYYSRHSSVLLGKAANLMKAVLQRPVSDSTMQLQIELSKAYLCRALSCEDSDSDSIYCLANVYLAVLYYTTGQYQFAIDHCTLVMISQNHSQCSAHIVQHELLPKIDDDTDNVVGLAVFYQHLRSAALNQQHVYVTAFTTELFAYYLHIKCLLLTTYQQLSDITNSQSSIYEVQPYVKYLNDTQHMFIADVLLWKLLKDISGHKFFCNKQSVISRYRSKYADKFSTSFLVKLLQKSAVENLTVFCKLGMQNFGSVATIVTTDFEALYAYKRGDYQRCLQLSTQNVHTLLYAVLLSNFSTFPEFIQLLDDDIISLTALTLIVNPECRDLSGYNNYTNISQLTLSLYLMTQCQLKLCHSVTSLAETLNYVKVAPRRHRVEYTLDLLVLKMIAYKAVTYITTMMK